jgi:hypothetical protein
VRREEYLHFLQNFILKKFGCRSIHFQTVPLKEEFHGRIVFQGDIEVFTLIGHPTAIRCFAWCHDDDSECVAFLALPPIITARQAMRQHIIDEFTGHA